VVAKAKTGQKKTGVERKQILKMVSLGVSFTFSEELWPDNLSIQSVAQHTLRVERERVPSPVENLTSDTPPPARITSAQLTTG
jgi:hypothetical protein